jgi:hypothetical protein
MVTTRLLIERDDGPLLEVGAGQNVLIPTDEGERAAAFKVLTDALALLAGVMPPESPAATEDEPDERCAGNARYPIARTDGVVVPLRGPSDSRAEG